MSTSGGGGATDSRGIRATTNSSNFLHRTFSRPRSQQQANYNNSLFQNNHPLLQRHPTGTPTTATVGGGPPGLSHHFHYHHYYYNYGATSPVAGRLAGQFSSLPSAPFGGGGGGVGYGRHSTPATPTFATSGLFPSIRTGQFASRNYNTTPILGTSAGNDTVGGVSSDHLRCVELSKDGENPSFGFNIKGGADFGLPVHIWRVEENSLADKQGLKSGQQIIQGNGVDFTNITHTNALKVLRGRKYVKLIIVDAINTNRSMLNAVTSMNGGGVGGLGSSSNIDKSSSLIGGGVTGASASMIGESGVGGGSVSYYSRPPSQSAMSSGSATGSSYTWIDSRGLPVPPPSPSHLSIAAMNKRIINIDINPGQNLGLMIRGGCEYGLGIYVTGVDHGSVASRAGLQRGDEILEVNGRNFTSITHDKAVQILKSSRTMTIIANFIGKIPADTSQTSQCIGGGGGGSLLSDAENTELIDLTTTSTASMASSHYDYKELFALGNLAGGTSKLLTTSMSEDVMDSYQHRHHHNILLDSTNVTLFDDDDIMNQDLIAEEEKLADQSLELDYTTSTDPSCGTSRLLHQDLEKSTSIMGMIEEKARTVLTKSEHSRFTFYRLEYQQGFLPIQTFVRILLELLNSVEKYTLLTEVREIVRPVDLVAFDELIYDKEAACLGKSSMMTPTSALTHRMGSEFPNTPSSQDPLLLPLVPVSSQGMSCNPSSMNGPLLPPRRLSPNSQYNNSLLYNETTFTTPTTSNPGHPMMNNGGLDRQLLFTHGDTHNVMAKLNQQKVMQQGLVGMNQNLQPHTTNNSCVRYKVKVQKTKPILGIAIEGGINTPHRLPRIIDVNTEGSAFGTQLKPGQVLLSVDGRKFDGLTHEEIARCILDSYMDMTKNQVEFIVVEAKASFLQTQQQVLHQQQQLQLQQQQQQLQQIQQIQQHGQHSSNMMQMQMQPPPLLPPPPSSAGPPLSLHNPSQHPHFNSNSLVSSNTHHHHQMGMDGMMG